MVCEIFKKSVHNRFSLIGLGCVLMALAGCNFGGSSQDAVKERVQQPKLRVINTLTQELYDDAHIKGSELVAFQDVEQVSNSWDKQTPVVFYCSNYQCSASREAARMLIKKGFKNVYAYEGGTAEWYQKGRENKAYKTVGPATMAYVRAELIRPEGHGEDAEAVPVVSAEQLLAMLQEAGLA